MAAKEAKTAKAGGVQRNHRVPTLTCSQLRWCYEAGGAAAEGQAPLDLAVAAARPGTPSGGGQGLCGG